MDVRCKLSALFERVFYQMALSESLCSAARQKPYPRSCQVAKEDRLGSRYIRLAAVLLHGGPTAHSQFKISINVNSSCTCGINAQSDLSKLIKVTTLIILVEAPMLHRHCVEAMNRTFKKIRHSAQPFVGIAMLFAGDFRYCLRVVARGSPSQIVHATLTFAPFWNPTTQLKLSQNMRLLTTDLTREARIAAEAWAQDLLDIGEGTKETNKVGRITVPEKCVLTAEQGLDALIDSVYPALAQTSVADIDATLAQLQDGAILDSLYKIKSHPVTIQAWRSIEETADEFTEPSYLPVSWSKWPP